MYISCGTRLDIAFVMGQQSHHKSNPCIRHIRIAKQVIHYLKGIITLGIGWRNNPANYREEEKYGEIDVVEYAVSSYACDIKDRKSITEYCFFLARGVITRCSKRQQTVLISTSEAKYVAVSQRVKEDVWIEWLLNELLPNQAVREMKMLGDNGTSLTLTRNL